MSFRSDGVLICFINHNELNLLLLTCGLAFFLHKHFVRVMDAVVVIRLDGALRLDSRGNLSDLLPADAGDDNRAMDTPSGIV